MAIDPAILQGLSGSTGGIFAAGALAGGYGAWGFFQRQVLGIYIDQLKKMESECKEREQKLEERIKILEGGHGK